MCPSCGGNQRGYQAYPYELGPYYHQQQQYDNNNHLDTYQNRLSPINTGYASSGVPMNRTSSYGSSDSGYVTNTPSAASPIPLHNYPIQSYSHQANPAHSYGPGRQLGEQSAGYSYGRQRSQDIEVIHTPPVSSSRHKRERRQSIPSPTSPSEYPCLYPDCGHISSRAHDLKRHMTVHFPPAVDELLDCKYEWCGRTGAYGFKREDHRKEHYRKVHMKTEEYPKTGKGGKSGGGSRRS